MQCVLERPADSQPPSQLQSSKLYLSILVNYSHEQLTHVKLILIKWSDRTYLAPLFDDGPVEAHNDP